MKRLAPCGITAWSWVSAQGKFHSEQPDRELEASLSRVGLESHEDDLGIPGYSGRYPDVLPPLPSKVRHRDSRCARLLWECLEPLRHRIDEAKKRCGGARIALVLGSSTGGIDATERALRFEQRHGHLPPDYRFVDVHPYDSLLELLEQELEITGPSLVVSTACSSAGKAMASAQRLLHTHQADIALVGGADALCEMTVRGFSGLGVLSGDPCRPFSADRTGISIGEGAALLLLEADSKAPIQFLGAGESSDAYHATSPHPEGVGAEIAMRHCLQIAGVSPEEVGYLNAHGTGTEKNDAMEAKAISRVLGENVVFSSTKNKTGHQLGTAGATEAIVCVQAVAEGTAPRNVDPKVWDTDLAARPAAGGNSVEVALSNSFAFGGSNVTVAVGKRRPNIARKKNGSACDVLGMTLWTPEHPNIDAWLRAEKNSPQEKPPAMLLSPRDRGRASTLTRIFAELYGQLCPEGLEKPKEAGARVPTIYCSRFGEMETTIKLLDQLEVEPQLSPIRFQASVHNTASGKISLTTKNRAFTTALAAGPSSFAMAIGEAQAWLACHGGELLVFVAEERLPKRLGTDINFPPMGIGFHLAVPGSASDRALGQIGPLHRLPAQHRLALNSPEEGDLDSLHDAPPAWGLALVEKLARRESAKVVVGPHWSVQLTSTDM